MTTAALDPIVAFMGHVRQLRDASVQVVKRGREIAGLGGYRLFDRRADRLRIQVNAPGTEWSDNGCLPPGARPHVAAVWCDGKRVLQFEWGATSTELSTYQAGDWESELLALARHEGAPRAIGEATP